jgi:hypothetical protein
MYAVSSSKQCRAARDGRRFGTEVYTATDPVDIDYDAVCAILNREIERFFNVGCGWNLTTILRFATRSGQYRPLAGLSFIPTPVLLVAKRALINVYNPNDSIILCMPFFLLSILTKKMPKGFRYTGRI